MEGSSFKKGNGEFDILILKTEKPSMDDHPYLIWDCSNLSRLQVRVRIAAKYPMFIPSYQSEGAAGMDLRAAEEVTIERGETVLVKCGFHIELPKGYEAQIRSRSGLARVGLTVANSPGTIDEDYRGEVCVLLHFTGMADRNRILIGDRIAQMLIAPVFKVQWEPVERESLSVTKRGEGRLGSTDIGESK